MDKLVSQTNLLLVKDDVGKPKPCTVTLPMAGHVYGKKLPKESNGVAVVTSSWATHKRSAPLKTKIDFIKVNKMTKEPVDYKVSIVLHNSIYLSSNTGGSFKTIS